jgi:hypothetical protein
LNRASFIANTKRLAQWTIAAAAFTLLVTPEWNVQLQVRPVIPKLMNKTLFR